MRRWSPMKIALAVGVAVIVLATVVVVRALATTGTTTGERWEHAAPTSASVTTGAAPSPAASSVDPVQKLAACVASTVSAMSAEERVGQLLMVGTPVANPPGLADTVGRYRLGGAFLAGRAAPAASTLRQGIQTLQGAAGKVPLLIAVDQEGGQVQTLKGNDFPLIPEAVEQGGWDSATLRARTTDWAKRLAAAGVTLDLAPVADTVPASVGEANPPIGAFNRQYGSAPDRVAEDIRTVVSAAQGAGVLTTLKHFPGLGRVRANTDTSASAVDEETTPDDPFLKPFVSGIEAGTAAVMISSARYPKLDANSVAAFSTPVVTGLLRQRLGYQGLVVSDDLGAAKAVTSVPVGERAVRFVRAGGDLVLTIQVTDAGPMATALLSAARASADFDARVTDAARHVVRAKYRAGLLTCR